MVDRSASLKKILDDLHEQLAGHERACALARPEDKTRINQKIRDVEQEIKNVEQKIQDLEKKGEQQIEDIQKPGVYSPRGWFREKMLFLLLVVISTSIVILKFNLFDKILIPTPTPTPIPTTPPTPIPTTPPTPIPTTPPTPIPTTPPTPIPTTPPTPIPTTPPTPISTTPPLSPSSPEAILNRLKSLNITTSIKPESQLLQWIGDPTGQYRNVSQECLDILQNRSLKSNGAYIDVIYWYYMKDKYGLDVNKAEDSAKVPMNPSIDQDTLREAILKAYNERNGLSAQSIDEIVQ